MEKEENTTTPAKPPAKKRERSQSLQERCLIECVEEQVHAEDGTIVKLKPFPLSPLARQRVMAQMLFLTLGSKSEKTRIQAAKVLIAAEAVNVQRERLAQVDEQGPAQHNTQINLYGGQVITGQIFASMSHLEREQALQAGAQLTPDAISALSPDELQRLLRSAQSIPPQLPNK